MGKRLEQTLAVLNGLIGDYLSRTHNGLATEMSLRRNESELSCERASLARALPNASSKLVVLVHGLMCTEDIWRMPDGEDYGSCLERDLGFTALYVRYNSGLPIADNGAQLSALLAQLCAAYPVAIEELLLVGYSMGGLVVRAACHTGALAQLPWLARVRRCVYVGTPHLGAPAERVGKVVAEVLHTIPNPYTRLISELGDLRSAGMKDLGHADLRHEDRVARSVWSLRDASHPVPLLASIEHHLIAGSMFGDPRLAVLFGDSLVPVVSATFAKQGVDALIPPERVRVIPSASHVALARHPAVYARLREICEEAR
ncbi:MAG: alpha/beta fold hydrolase [Polyangiales bacterium]